MNDDKSSPHRTDYARYGTADSGTHSPEMPYAMLEEAMLDDQFRYGLKNTLVYIHEGKSRWSHLWLSRAPRRCD